MDPPAAVARSAGGFPISIEGFEVVSGDRSGRPGVGIRFRLSVNLHENTISGGTTLSIWGALQTSSSGPPSFVFSGIDLDSIGLRADLGAVAIAGSVRFYNNDATYGNGFRGAVTANFVRMVEIGATVQFGTVGDIRYWYVDARAIVGSGIPIFSGVALYGFGGGAWYNMRRVVTPDSVLPRSTEAANLYRRQRKRGSHKFRCSLCARSERLGILRLSDLWDASQPRYTQWGLDLDGVV
jgi:hypothetical protein